MDLSQQELPLTSYFLRSGKEATSRAIPSKKEQSVAHPSKRRNNAVGSAGRSKLRPTTLQMPTPATSARKRLRSGRPVDLPSKAQPTLTSTSLSSVEQNAIFSSEDDLAQLELEPTPLKSPRSSPSIGEAVIPHLLRAPLATPPTNRRKPTMPNGPGLTLGFSGQTVAGIVTPRTLFRRKSDSVHNIDDNPVTRSNYPGLTPPTPRLPESGVSHTVPGGVEHLDRSDPFYAHERDGIFLGGGDLFAPPTKCPNQLDKSSDGHAIPMIPVPSSQSQYLLHLDATPKRKRRSRRIEHVISSQSQEERELVLYTPHKPTVVGFSAVSPRINVQIPLNRSEKTSQHVHTLGSIPVGSPINTAAGPPHPFFAAKVPPDGVQCGSSPSRHKKLMSHRSPGVRIRTPRKSCHDSIEVPPVNVEDSLTESESDPDIPLLKNRSSAFALPSQNANHAPRHSPVARDACSQDNIPGMEDDSATEAESDTEILHCVAEIGKKRSRAYCSEVSKKDTTPPPVISPLVSPARSRVAVMPSIICAQFPAQGGVGPSTSGSYASCPSGTEQLKVPLETLPSVVRDFIRMFPGDESYPADFPASLRV